MMRIQKNEQGVIHNRPALLIGFRHGITGETKHEGADRAAVPILVSHSLPIRTQPGNILDLRSMDLASLKKAPTPENRVVLPQANETLREYHQLPGRTVQFPVVPTDLIVLAVCIVVALLRPSDLVAPADHWDTLRKQEQCQAVPLLSLSEVVDGRIGGRPLDTAIPAQVVVRSVRVVFTIRFVVLVVVRDEIVESESIVRRDEIDARKGAPPAPTVQVAAPRQPIPQLRHLASITFHVPPDGVPVFAVPLGPADRKVADLIAAFAHVPGLRDQLDLGQDGILVEDVEERTQPVDRMLFSRERGGEIETKSVHVHLRDPVTQTIHDELQSPWMLDVERVSASRIVRVIAIVVRRQPVIDGIVDPSKREGRTEVIAFRRMVVDHVQDDLDSGTVEGLDHALEFPYMAPRTGDVA